MTSSKIEELKRQRQLEQRKRGNQKPYAILLAAFIVVIYLAFTHYNLRFSSYWLIGILIGITMQRSRFCFCASFRDPIMVGSTSLLKAIILALFISTIGFFIIQYKAILANPNFAIHDIPGHLHPVGIHTALGAVLFGIGMVVAGGCASGVLVRIGEGYMMQMVVLVGFLIGTFLGARHFVFWDRLLVSKSTTVYFPNYIGLFPSLFLQLVLLAALYFIADWYDKRNNIMTTV